MGVFVADISAQSFTNKITVPIPKELQKGTIVSAKKTDNNQFEIVLSSKPKKEMVFKQYIFDQDLNKVEENDITFETFKTKNKHTELEGTKDLPRFVQVNKTMLFQELKIEKGYLQRTYNSFSDRPDLNYHSDKLVIEEKMTVKSDDERKLVPILTMYVDDEPITPRSLGYNEPGYYAKGDLVVLCEVFPKLFVKEEKQPGMGVGCAGISLAYCAVRFNAENLNTIKKVLIPFDYVQKTEVKKEIQGKRILLITKDYPGKAPVSMGIDKYYNTGSKRRTVTIVNKEGTVEAQYNFDGLEDMEVWDVEEAESGNIYITGKINQKKNTSFFVAKLVNKQLEYITQTTTEELKTNISKPASDKKFITFDENLKNHSCVYKGLFELANGHVLFVYQQKDGEKRTNLHYLQFDQTGKLFKEYTNALAEDFTAQYTRPTGNAHINMNININQDNTFSILIQEEVEGKGKYMRVAKVNFMTGEFGEFISSGQPTDGDKNKYFLDKQYPMLINSNNEVILVGKSDKRDALWLTKLKVD
ncbi:MAG: hypothetical protein A2X12_02310 [Bacteroidetes bacterium GWE2_29_8]|nr:MAG: hypothetical protein A2X12_02310 [Bacteroidetes bacterium GWE2_29_8]OFY14599.1 MAG: hypothetical protein A2X02_05895 [Bacteroidetes bacterium GWF2_29_10]